MKPASSDIIKYGQKWNNPRDDLDIELTMMAQPEPWLKQQGTTLLQHYLAARKLAWPNRYEHRWTRLIYEEILKNRITVLMGSASSQKSSHAAEFVLLDYWAHPDNTAVLISSTTRDKLESAVWGEVKMLYQSAKDLHPWLAGHPLEHKQAILTDEISEFSIRDFRKGLVAKPCYVGKQYVGLGVYAGIKQERLRFLADECFPAGTMVDTPSGLKRIETIKRGDKVFSAAGIDIVESTMTRTVASLIKVSLSDGRSIICTPEHRFFTQYGWERAVDLSRKQYMVGVYESMQILRSPNQEQSFLQFKLQREMGNYNDRRSGQVLHEGTGTENICCQVQNAQGTPGVCTTTTNATVARQLYEESNDEGKGKQGIARHWLEAARSWWKRTWTNRIREDSTEAVCRCCQQLSSSYWRESRKRISDVLQSGRGIPTIQVSRGSGRSITQQSGAEVKGFQKANVLGGAWVESVEGYKPDGQRKNRGGGIGYKVFNLHVIRHPSYGVNGFLAHNCQFMAPTFLDCLDNMSSNTQAGGLKVICSGNPKHDPDDQLGIAAEPIDGWESVADREKTSVWDTRMYRARCVNLIGTDSPNFDVGPDEPEPYPKLIGWQFAKIIEHDHGRNSPQFETQVMGRMKLALAHARVITRDLCRQHKAHDKVIWRGTTPSTKIMAIDPAYGGGDRCIEMSGEFGLDDTGKTVIRIGGYKIIKIDLKRLDEKGQRIPPEDQIANEVWEDASRDGVPATNIFYDSFGKGTIGFAFARKFGATSPVPVDSGAQPSKRPVRQDLFVLDETRRQKRLKRCDEHYSKFVTEMWFSVRYAIEAEQIRELPIDVMLEGCTREYYTVAGNKIEVEPKDKMRERMGKSPDLFDAAGVLVEGARRLGFQIDKLGSGLTDGEDGFNWLDDWRKSHESLIRSKQLQYK